MKKPALDQATLKRMLDYDPETGVFTWKHRPELRPQWNGRYAGKAAGYAREATGGNLYWSVRIFDWPFHAGPLAWLYMTGEWPAALVDHADNDGLNNRWGNLREADRSQNAANARLPKNNTSGLKGACLCKKTGRWRATIRLNGKQAHLGNFTSPEEAHAAYMAAARVRSGEYARAA